MCTRLRRPPLLPLPAAVAVVSFLFFLLAAAVTWPAQTGTFTFTITATCPSGTSTTTTPPTCFMPDSYRIEELISNAWGNLAGTTGPTLLKPPTGSTTPPNTFVLAGLPVPTTRTFRVVTLLNGVDGTISNSFTGIVSASNVNVVLGIGVTVP